MNFKKLIKQSAMDSLQHFLAYLQSDQQIDKLRRYNDSVIEENHLEETGNIQNNIDALCTYFPNMNPDLVAQTREVLFDSYLVLEILKAAFPTFFVEAKQPSIDQA